MYNKELKNTIKEYNKLTVNQRDAYLMRISYTVALKDMFSVKENNN